MKITQVVLLTSDLESTEIFYTNKLQLKLLSKDEDSISFVAGHSLLIFKLTKSFDPVYHIAFEIPHNKLNDVREWSKERIDLIEFDDKEVVVDFENWNAKSVYFYDDNQNILEFIGRYDNNTESNESFNAASILNISEVGLVNEDVLQLAEKLTANYDLQHFEKQPPRSNFCAMGNSNGLFVISGNDRHWFPTNSKAVKFPVIIKFEEKDKVYEFNYQ